MSEISCQYDHLKYHLGRHLNRSERKDMQREQMSVNPKLTTFLCMFRVK